MDLAVFTPTVRELLTENRLPELGPGGPNTAARSALEALNVEGLFGSRKVVRPDLAQCCLAALWLYHDYLDQSHAISRDISATEGSYWHGIMHRREPDYSNAAYWFRRVGNHPVFNPLCREAAQLARGAGSPEGSGFLGRQPAWDPFAFIDLCEAVAGGRTQCEPLCRQVQRAEWQLLFAYCYSHAVGGNTV
jgi:hypothetical protein